jgi:polar amino acid transport system permease protein
VDWQLSLRYLPDLLEGLAATLLLSAEVILLGTILGLALVPLRISARAFVRMLAWWVINPFRILPVLVLLVWGFYAIPIGIGFRVEPWWVAVIALGLNMGAFCAEIFRKAVEEVPAEHVEAAQLLGFRRTAVWCRIVLPLASRNASVPYLNQVLQTIKLTVLAAMISVREIYHVSADIIQQTNKPLEIYTMLAIVLFVPLLGLTLLVEWTESRSRAHDTVQRWSWLASAR